MDYSSAKNRSGTAVLLLNVGTPDSADVASVRRYLSQFLNDPYVIDLPWLARKLLVNLIIVPFRAPKSTKLYRKLWNEGGSPLLYLSNRLQHKLQMGSNNQHDWFVAMRYGNPSVGTVLRQIKQAGYKKLVILPLFPQYALSTTETALQEVSFQLKKLAFQPDIKIINQFYSHRGFIHAFASRIRYAGYQQGDYLLFSYHGLPVSHIQKIHPQVDCAQCSCQFAIPEHGANCYKATCYETSRLLAAELGLSADSYTTSFQSRFSKNWLTPFTDETLKDLADKGVKRVVVAAPSFITDCLETIIEIGEEYQQLFIQAGGKELVMVESLNDSDLWVSALHEIVGQ